MRPPLISRRLVPSMYQKGMCSLRRDQTPANASLRCTADQKSEQTEDEEVDGSHEICKLVGLQREGDQEGGALYCQGEQEGDTKVVRVENDERRHDCSFPVEVWERRQTGYEVLVCGPSNEVQEDTLGC